MSSKRADLYEVFIRVNGTESVKPAEFQKACTGKRKNSFRDILHAKGVSWKDVFATLDSNHDGVVDFEEFFSAATQPPSAWQTTQVRAASGDSRSEHRAQAATQELKRWIANGKNAGMLQRSISKYENRAKGTSFWDPLLLDEGKATLADIPKKIAAAEASAARAAALRREGKYQREILPILDGLTASPHGYFETLEMAAEAAWERLRLANNDYDIVNFKVLSTCPMPEDSRLFEAKLEWGEEKEYSRGEVFGRDRYARVIVGRCKDGCAEFGKLP